MFQLGKNLLNKISATIKTIELVPAEDNYIFGCFGCSSECVSGCLGMCYNSCGAVCMATCSANADGKND